MKLYVSTDPTAEKMVRGAIKGAVERELGTKVFVLVDTLNFVKGFRYELHCIARTVRTTHCVVRPLVFTIDHFVFDAYHHEMDL